MKVKTKETSYLLTFNEPHQNFTSTEKIVPGGTELDGEFKEIKGLRRGEPFIYKVFEIPKIGHYIYKNNTIPMENTEVTLNASGPILKVKSNQYALLGGAIGAGIGYAFAVYRKEAKMQTKLVYAVAGATIIGLGTHFIFKNQK